MAERMSVLYNASKCTACQACSVACKQWNTLPAEKTVITTSIQGHNDFTPKTWTFISFRESFENKKMHWLFRKDQCLHCGQAGCEKACPQHAISHTELGFVVIDHNKCIGCGYCVTNCTFHIPRVDETTHKSYKCTGCPERVANGLNPACVQTCQPEALVYGTRKQIVAMAEKRVKVLLPNHPKAKILTKGTVSQPINSTATTRNKGPCGNHSFSTVPYSSFHLIIAFLQDSRYLQAYR